MKIQAIKQTPREITLNKQQAKEHREHEIQAYTNIKKSSDKYQSNLDTKSRFNPTRIHDRYKVNKLNGKGELHKENFHVLNRLHQTGGGKVNLGKSASGKRLRYDPNPTSASQSQHG